MNELQTYQMQLPDTIEDLSRFVLVGREKLNAVRAEIRAIEKVGLAKQVHEQKLAEAQEIAEAVLDAEVKIGQLTSKMPKAKGGAPFHSTNRNDAESTKAEQLAKAGIKQDTAERYEQLYRHSSLNPDNKGKDIVEQAKAEARERGEVVSRTAVIRQIAAETPPVRTPKNNAVEAKLRHDEFKKSDVVSIDEAKQDKADRRTIAYELYKDITSITHKATITAIWNSSKDLDDLMEIIPDERWPRFSEGIDTTIYLLTRIKERRSEWKAKVSTRAASRQ